jgi:Recombinase
VAPTGSAWPEDRAVARTTPNVQRLAYTRSQAAEALGVSRSTFIRRVLPYVETIEMPWGAKLIPVDELERLLAERRRAAEVRSAPATRGRPPLVSAEVIGRIRSERAAGASLRRIAAGLNADGVATAHGGAQWWPSSVRAILAR